MHYLIFFFFGLISYPLDTFEITIENIKEVKGTIYIAVYDDPTSFPEDDLWKERYHEKVNSTSMSIIIPEVDLNKEYAFAIYHDVNDNGEMDKNWMGIPKEPFGFSNNVKPKFSAPEFESCKIVPSQSDPIEISLIHKIIF